MEEAYEVLIDNLILSYTRGDIGLRQAFEIAITASDYRAVWEEEDAKKNEALSEISVEK